MTTCLHPASRNESSLLPNHRRLMLYERFPPLDHHTCVYTYITWATSSRTTTGNVDGQVDPWPVSAHSLHSLDYSSVVPLSRSRRTIMWTEV